MPVYQCRVGSERGDVQRRSIIADSIDQVRKEVESKGLFLLSARRSWADGFLGRGGPVIRRRISEQDFLIFNQEFAALVRSGLTILKAFDVIVERLREGFFKQTLLDIREKIRSGSLLSEAFREKSDAFPPVYAASLLAGERSGNLDAVLRRYMAYQQQMLEAQRKVRSALIYPAVLLTVAGVIGSILIVYIVPRFAQIYSDYGAELPATTTMLIGTATFMSENLLPVLVVLAALFLAFRGWARKESGRLTLDRWKFRIPLVGPVWHEFSIAQFARTLSTLLAGGIPVVDSVEVAAGAMSNTHMSQAVHKSVQKIKEGQSLSTALDSTNVFSPMSLEMIQVGESTGSLDQLLTEVANFYDQRVDTRVSTLLALLEPIVLVVMAVVIAFMLISIYLPLFNLTRVTG